MSKDSDRPARAARAPMMVATIVFLLTAGPADLADTCPRATLPRRDCQDRLATGAVVRTAEYTPTALSNLRLPGTARTVPAVDRSSGTPPFRPAPTLEPARFPYYAVVRRVADRHGVDPSLVLAIIASESGGNPTAVSPAGAIGLMQLMPATARHLGVDPWNPVENVEGAVRYLASLRARFPSDDLSLVAYNAGPTFAARYLAGKVELGAETRAFLMRVAHVLARGGTGGSPATDRQP